MSKSTMKATSLRTVLVVCLLIIFGISVGGFLFVQDWLSKNIPKADESSSQTDTGSLNAQQTTALKKEMARISTETDKASVFTASAQDYQDRTKQSLNTYALNTGIAILISDSTTLSAQPGPGLQQPSGVQSGNMTVTITNPVIYSNLIKFLQAIETSLPAVKISGISINQVGGSGDTVSVEPITIEAYYK